MSQRPTTFHLIDGFPNYSPIVDIPAAKLMDGDDGQRYEQGWAYIFDEGQFLFFNGQLWPQQLVRKVVSTSDGVREAEVWETIPRVDPVAEALRPAHGSITLIHEPDRG